ncbi:MAG TPA: hypothetical protein VFK44_02195 [Bacillales bacterium]|nr:hypothetical protein [Bacillales bacterium]
MHKEKPLRFCAPDLYEPLNEALKAENLHSFDVEAIAVEEPSRLRIRLAYGERFEHTRSFFIEKKNAKTPSAALGKFYKNTLKHCKEVLIESYYSNIKP